MRASNASSEKSDESILRDKMERFKPLNSNFGKRKKEHADEVKLNSEPGYKSLRNTTLSDESGRDGTIETSASADFDGAKKS